MKENEILNEAFRKVNWRLQLAESKLVALVIINTTLIVTLCRYVDIIVSILFLVSSIIALYGLKSNATLGIKLYYQHILECTKEEYMQEVKEDYFKDIELNKIQLDCMEEIWEKANIVQYRSLVFNITFVVDIVAMLIVIF